MNAALMPEGPNITTNINNPVTNTKPEIRERLQLHDVQRAKRIFPQAQP